MATKIYTKTGDAGITSLLGGTRVPKNHHQLEAYGTIDELNAHIGMVASYLLQEKHWTDFFITIQNQLFVIGSLLAVEPNKEETFRLPSFHPKHTTALEHQIDLLTEQLPLLKNFILPSGNQFIATIHIARCVCRRAERYCVTLSHQQKELQDALIYINRLSDFLFVFARYQTKQSGLQESIWKPDSE